MSSPAIDIQQVKDNLRATWMAGDFGRIAAHSALGAEEFVARLGLHAGMRVLDVACGTGNLSLPAASAGAAVTGVDIATNLLEQARERAAAAGLSITFDEGDAEQLPYPDASFDVVMSMFGAMFAPRSELAAAELTRVCKPGGTIAMANWTREGFVGQTFVATARHAPPPPGPPSPLLWGEESIVRDRLAANIANLTLTRRDIELDYPFPPDEVVAFFRAYFGPTAMTFVRLDPPAQAALAADLEQMWRERNQAGPGHTRVSAEYLEVVAIRA